MNIRIVSDIHAEFFRNGGDPEVTEQLMEAVIPYLKDEKDMVLVLAGDIVTIDCMQQYTPWLKDLSQRHKAVVYVGGNHECYHGNRAQSIHYWKYIASTIPNFYVLENDVCYIDNIRFLGTTMYTALDGPLDHMFIQEMSDLDYVTGLNVGVWRHIHNTAVEFLTKFLQEVTWDGKTVVVTHHAPSYQSIVGKYRNSNVNCCYASHLDNLVGYSNASLWCHGHMHDSSDYTLGDTRVVCNPHGYYGEYVNPDFNPTMVVEV